MPTVYQALNYLAWHPTASCSWDYYSSFMVEIDIIGEQGGFRLQTHLSEAKGQVLAECTDPWGVLVESSFEAWVGLGKDCGWTKGHRWWSWIIFAVMPREISHSRRGSVMGQEEVAANEQILAFNWLRDASSQNLGLLGLHWELPTYLWTFPVPYGHKAQVSELLHLVSTSYPVLLWGILGVLKPGRV